MGEIKITAVSVEGFKSIQEKLDSLPTEIKNQIERADYFITVNCYFNDIFSKIYLPKESLRELSHKGDWIIAYCKDFTFHITKNSTQVFNFI